MNNSDQNDKTDSESTLNIAKEKLNELSSHRREIIWGLGFFSLIIVVILSIGIFCGTSGLDENQLWFRFANNVLLTIISIALIWAGVQLLSEE